MAAVWKGKLEPPPSFELIADMTNMTAQLRLSSPTFGLNARVRLTEVDGHGSGRYTLHGFFDPTLWPIDPLSSQAPDPPRPPSEFAAGDRVLLEDGTVCVVDAKVWVLDTRRWCYYLTGGVPLGKTFPEASLRPLRRH